jgi:hypothetical protein
MLYVKEHMNFTMADRGLKYRDGKNTLQWKLTHEGLNPNRRAGTSKLHTAIKFIQLQWA